MKMIAKNQITGERILWESLPAESPSARAGRGRGRPLLIGLLFAMVSFSGNAQLSLGGDPLKSRSPENEPEWIDLEEVRVDELLLEDKWAALTGRKSQRFAKEIQVSIQPEHAGNWEELTDGTLIWRVGIRGKGAKALGIEFSRYLLEPGTKIFIYSTSGEKILGAYTSHNNKESGSLPVSYLPGEELIIQMEVSPECENYGELKVGFVRWAYLPVFEEQPVADYRFNKSGACNIDINCSLGDNWQVRKNSVVRLITATEKCTGVLINNTRQDGKAYIYTAAHCVFNHLTHMYQNPIFYFNYENTSCGGSDGSIANSISDATLIATGDIGENPQDADSLDFALLELSIAPPDSFLPYFAGWNRSSFPAKNTAAIHHPSGDVKKISIDDDPPEASYHAWPYFEEFVKYSFWRILEWDTATTEGGSSGCPLFDQDQLVVGTLTGGEANCIKSINDYFTRFDYAWDYYADSAKQLKRWLDPDDTGVMNLQGMYGYPQAIARRPGPQELSLYPNPARSMLTVETDLPHGKETEISIFNVTGRLHMKRTLVWDGSARLDVSGMQPGLYIFRLRQDMRVVTRRFVITR